MTDHKDMLSCPACGYELETDDCEWSEDGAYGYDGKVCPNCGCKTEKDERVSGELLPCPFCGREPAMSNDDYGDFIVYCPNYDCPASNNNWFESKEEAVEAWNIRVERTGTMDRDEYGYWVCSECGETLPDWVDKYPAHFCPYCGVKVAQR